MKHNPMSLFTCLPVLAVLLPAWGVAHAYERSTHQQISRAAVSLSLIGTDASLRASLALDDPAVQQFPDANGSLRTVMELVAFGAHAEDDGVRSLNHFYDPVSGRPLTILGVPAGLASPTWALESTFPIQHYSHSTAARYYKFALTLQTKTERERYWGLFFQTLGHVIHHVQDMAQPQHVRNDPHLPLGDPSLYEGYTRDNAAKLLPYLTSTRFVSSGAMNPADLWANSSGTGMAQFTNRNFVSKDTNFLYVRGQIQTNGYNLPVPGAKYSRTFQELNIPNADQLCDSVRAHGRPRLPPSACAIEFYRTAIVGGNGGDAPYNERGSSRSALDQYLRDANGEIAFTLNRFNFDSGYEFLMTRAVGYSATLINSFFPVQLELREPAIPVAADIRFAVKLKTSSANMSNATVSVFYDGLDGERHELNVRSGKTVSSLQTPHAITVDPPPEWDWLGRRLTLVIEGTVNSKTAIAARIFPVEPQKHGLVVFPDFTPTDNYVWHKYIERDTEAWHLSPANGFSVGRFDWKGQYDVDGNAQRVLTWNGPARRSVELALSNGGMTVGGSNAAIFEFGGLFSYAPAPIRGVAVAKDAGGNEWLLAITDDPSGISPERLYKRPNTFSTSSALYDPVTAPSGWQPIALDWTTSATGYGTWYFNGSGTEAQTMRQTSPSHPSKFMTRLKLQISPDLSTATVVDLGNELINWNSQSTVNYSCSSQDGVQTVVRTSTGSRQEWGTAIVAVDYVGDEEILARVTVDRARTDYSYEQQPGTDTFSTSDHYRVVLSLGGEEIVLLDRTSNRSGTVQEVSEWADVEYLDLRNGTIVLYRHTENTTSSGSTLQTIHGPDEIKLKRGALERTLYSASETSTSSSPWGPTTSSPQCGTSSSSSNQGQIPIYRDYQRAEHESPPNHAPFLPIAPVGGTLAVATDVHGNLFASLRKSGSAPFTYLEGGSIEETFGLPGPLGFKQAAPN